MVYIGDDGFLRDLSEKTLSRSLGGEGVSLRSRQCKTCRLFVWAGQGIACSSDGGQLGFLEIFLPRSHQDYLDTIYEEPPPFRK